MTHPTRWIPATHEGASRIAITVRRSNTSSPRSTARRRRRRSGPGAVITVRPAASPTHQPTIPPVTAPTNAQIRTGVMSSLCLAATIAAAISSGSPGPGSPTQLANAPRANAK